MPGIMVKSPPFSLVFLPKEEFSDGSMLSISREHMLDSYEAEAIP